jgi:hypothetical protein
MSPPLQSRTPRRYDTSRYLKCLSSESTWQGAEIKPNCKNNAHANTPQDQAVARAARLAIAIIIGVVSKCQIAFESKAQADEKAQHT